MACGDGNGFSNGAISRGGCAPPSNAPRSTADTQVPTHLVTNTAAHCVA